jgi:hypothetical protein
MSIVIGRGERNIPGGENAFDSTDPSIRRDVQAAHLIAIQRPGRASVPGHGSISWQNRGHMY